MRYVFQVVFFVFVFSTQAAFAHFKLTYPQEWIITDNLGDPQKTSPCGSTTGTPSNQTLDVVAGSELKIKWTETYAHGGHYRIAIAKDRSTLVDAQTVVQNNDCKSAAIQTNPVAPVIADGIFQTAAGAQGMNYEYTITVPSTPCTGCTLQVVQFMKPHQPSCFYYHCANINIVAAPPDGGTQPAAGGSVSNSGGAVSTNGGTASTSGGTASSGTGGTTQAGTQATGTKSGCASVGGFAALLAAVVLARKGRKNAAL